MQKAVADDQISLPKQSTSKHLLKGLTKEGDLQLLLLGPLPGDSQHRFGTVNADDPSLGEEAGQPKRDVSRPQPRSTTSGSGGKGDVRERRR